MDTTNEASELNKALAVVKSHDWSTNRRVADELAKIGQSAVPRLIEALNDKDGYVRDVAAKALGKIGDGRAVEPLIHAMQYRDEQVYEDDEDSEARASAAIALGRIGDTRAFEPLAKAVSDDDLQLSWYAIEALGMIGDPRAISILIDSLEHPDFDRRRSARAALVKFGKEAVLPLISILKDKNRRWRIFAIDALGKIGDTRAIGSLRELLKDQDEHVHHYAAEAIKAIEKQEI